MKDSTTYCHTEANRMDGIDMANKVSLQCGCDMEVPGFRKCGFLHPTTSCSSLDPSISMQRLSN